MKKIYRIILKKFSIFFVSNLSKFLSFFNLKIIPSHDEKTKYTFEYSKDTRRFIYKPSKDLFSKLIIDTSHFVSDLCIDGAYYRTNKSAFNNFGHRSGYTPYYDIIFRHLKNEKINFAEIGIENNASTKMWRKYFSKAKIYGLEYDEIKIRNAKKNNLKDTIYKKIDVSDQESIKKTFSKINKKFDVIIDDSTHILNHQINIIKNVHPFLKKNGILIIEDIYKYRHNYSEKIYYQNLNKLKKNFRNIYFIEFHNINNFTASWKNEKLLILIKK